MSRRSIAAATNHAAPSANSHVPLRFKPRRPGLLAGLGVAALTLACGGSDGPTTPPQPEIASVTVSAPASELFVGNTMPLVASVRDENGSTVGTAVTWESSNTSVATVSGSGLVTAVGGGQSTISARAPRRNLPGSVRGETSIQVPSPDGSVGPGGGTVPDGTSSVAIEVAAGSVSATTQITIIPFAGSVPPNPANFLLVPGTVFSFGPDGTQFSNGATLTMGYNPAAIPNGLPEVGLAIFRLAGSAWVPVGAGSVDTDANLVTGAITSFSVYGVLASTIITNAPPTASITQPADQATFEIGEPITFEGTGSDPEDGSLTGSALVWTSSLEGELATGTTFQQALSPGSHVIELTVTDSGGMMGTAQRTITVTPNTAPTATILSPATQSTFVEGTPIQFTGSGTDPDNFDALTFVWSSSIDPPFGTTESVTTTLSVGVHSITFTVNDAFGGSDLHQITVNVEASSGASEFHWNNPAGGDWSNPANWLENAVPTNRGDVFITLPGSYTVTLLQDHYDDIGDLTVGGEGEGQQRLVINDGDVENGMVVMTDDLIIGSAGRLEATATFFDPTSIINRGVVSVIDKFIHVSGPYHGMPGSIIGLNGNTVLFRDTREGSSGLDRGPAGGVMENEGALFGPGNVFMEAGRRATGGWNQMGGQISPAGHIAFGGDLQLTDASVFTEIRPIVQPSAGSGLPAIDADWLEVGDDLTITGSFLEVEQYQDPDPGASFDLITYSNLNGLFDAMNGLGRPDGSTLQYTYGPNALSLVLPAGVMDYNTFGGHTYGWLPASLSWHDQVAAAAALGGHLVVVNDAAENQFLVENYATPFREFWMGLSDERVEGVFEWIDDTPLGYTNWAGGEPSGGNENCGEFVWTWNDLSCTTGRPAVVEWDFMMPLSLSHFATHQGHQYALSLRDLTWTQARDVAASVGGHLVVVDDAAENAFLTTQYAQVTDFWMGLTDRVTEGLWLWVDGTPFVYENWAAGEPNDAGGEDCAVYWGVGGEWNDLPCWENDPFVIEWNDLAAAQAAMQRLEDMGIVIRRD